MSGLGIGKRRLIDMIIETNWKDQKKKFSKDEMLFVIQEVFDEEGKKYFEGRTSRRGHTIFKKFMELLLYRNLANYDSMVLITADKGMGKSSAAIMMARCWCKLIGIRFNPARHIAYNNADLMNKIDNLNKFEPIICDEAVRFASACITGDTMILTPIGEKNIKSLVNKENFEVYSFNEKTKKQEIKKATKCIKVKKDMVYELITEDGKKIRATKEHKFLTTNGWKTLEELKNGDSIIKA